MINHKRIFPRFFIPLLLFIFISSFSVAQTRILFLGNSYTAVNNLPNIVKDFAADAGINVTVSSNTPGGYTLQQHCYDATSLNLIAQGNWDYVVLQEQSQKPSWPMSQVSTEVLPYAKRLDSLIKVANPCTKTVFYMTWGRKNGDSYNCANWPPVCTYEGMDSLLRLRYQMMADNNKALVSPVGPTWRYIRQNNPNLELYASDESHPSAAGSFAAAASFFTVIFQQNPANVGYRYTLSASDAQIIKNAAKSMVYDSLAQWNVGKFLPEALFSYTQNTNTVSFTNLSSNASNYLWNFGDGDTSTLFSPVHIYSHADTFIVQLEVRKCDLMDSISKIINILPSGFYNSKANNTKLTIQPNPSKGIIQINSDNSYIINSIRIFNIQGKQVYRLGKVRQNSQIDMSFLKAGIYLFEIEVGNQIIRKKVVFQ